jgi:hypothetical protein
MIIPASHVSGFWLPKNKQIPFMFNPERTYDDYSKIQNVPAVVASLREKYTEYLEFMKKMENANTYTQYYTFEQQLEFGVRLFDLRFILDNEDTNAPSWIINHRKIKKEDVNIFDILEQANKFLESECKEEFIILKIELNVNGKSGGKSIWIENLLKHLGEKKLDTRLFFNLAGESVPKYKEVTGKIWIIPEGDFDPETIKIHYNLKEEPKTWSEVVIEGNDKSLVGKKEKKEEFNKWMRHLDMSYNGRVLDYFGFNVSYYSGGKVAFRFVKDIFRKAVGTQKGKILFDSINTIKFKMIHRGVIAMDWATPKRVLFIIKQNIYSMSNERKRLGLK